MRWNKGACIWSVRHYEVVHQKHVQSPLPTCLFPVLVDHQLLVKYAELLLSLQSYYKECCKEVICTPGHKSMLVKLSVKPLL